MNFPRIGANWESGGHAVHGVKAAAAPPWRYAPALTPHPAHPKSSAWALLTQSPKELGLSE